MSVKPHSPVRPVILSNNGNIELIRSLLQQSARFLIVGGAAVAVHGCRRVHEVADLDVLIDPSTENASRVLNSIPAQYFSTLPPVTALARPSVQLPLKAWHFLMDILTPEQGDDFQRLMDRSVEALLDGLVVRVVGRDDLVSMKEAAVSRLGAELNKHQRDLACLKQAV